MTNQAELMMDLGKDRYKAKSEKLIERGHLSNTTVGQSLMRQVIGPFADYLKERIAIRAKAAGGPTHYGVYYTKQLGVDLTAYLGTRAIIDLLMRKPSTLMSVASNVADVLESELQFQFLKTWHIGAWKDLLEKTKTMQPKYRRKKMRRQIPNLSKVDIARIPFNERGSWGLFVVSCFREATGLIEKLDGEWHGVYKTRGKKRPPTTIALSQDCVEWINNTLEKHESLFPLYLPTTEKPRDWKNQYEGGYPPNVTMRSGIVKKLRFRDLKKYDPKEMPSVFASVNRIQRVPWTLNGNVYDLARHFWDIDVPVDKVPRRSDHEFPEEPLNVDTDDEARWNYRKDRCVVYRRNIELRSHRSQFMRILMMADTIKDSTFYYPYNLDFRGRTYPIASFLCPQGTPMARAMLQFKEAKPILKDNGSEDWLAIHGANTWGLDKRPFEERIGWVEDNREFIEDVAKDPLGCNQWQDADDPFGFYRFCLEWSAFMDHGYGFMSHLPVQMDGTNNGLQLFSLIMRDMNEAIATNVYPGVYPHDIYQEVADGVTEQIRASESEYAPFWINFLNGGQFPRSATKRPVMTFPYGARTQSCSNYLMEWYKEEQERRFNGRLDLVDTESVDNWKRCNWLGSIVWEEIGKKLSGSIVAMKWLKGITQRIIKETGKHVRWTSPSGFPVEMKYFNSTRSLIKTSLNEQIVIQGNRKTNTLAVAKNAQAISANFIHSVDAALLMRTVDRAGKEGVSSVAPVHDCFGVLAADAPVMARCIREEASEMFSGHLLEDLRKELEAWSGLDLEEPPEQGELDPSCVMNSLYFFS